MLLQMNSTAVDNAMVTASTALVLSIVTVVSAALYGLSRFISQSKFRSRCCARQDLRELHEVLHDVDDATLRARIIAAVERAHPQYVIAVGESTPPRQVSEV